jgi:glycerol kinase
VDAVDASETAPADTGSSSLPKCRDDSDCEGAYYLKICQEGVCCNGTFADGRCSCHGGRACEHDEVCCPDATGCTIALGLDPCKK